MRAEFDFLARGYTANLYRIRAARLRELISERSKASRTDELLAEAKWCEDKARMLDDAIEPTSLEVEPIRADPRLDLDAADAPKNGKAEAP